MITVDHMHFEIIENYRDAFDEEQFQEKYSEVLNKYDYIVGDIGYEKLRLAGFFRDNKAKADRDKKFSAVQDYLYEYCNFGCAYFILRKVTKPEIKEMIENGELEARWEEDGESDSAEERKAEESTESDTSEVETEDEKEAPGSGTLDRQADPQDNRKETVQKDRKPQHKRKPSSRSRKKAKQQKQKSDDQASASNKTLAAHQSFKKS